MKKFKSFIILLSQVCLYNFDNDLYLIFLNMSGLGEEGGLRFMIKLPIFKKKIQITSAKYIPT